MASFPEIRPGGNLRLPLLDNNRATGGAFQLWQGKTLIYQGSSYGLPLPGTLPDIWRPIGLLQREESTYSIFLYIPTDAPVGEYELRIATTVGSRSGRFLVL